ncbi:MAG: hypothetical protein JWN86_2634 [Planctomycetota bacterium]|nr:hypothetical protein [Planctomycetota bacterium]
MEPAFVDTTKREFVAMTNHAIELPGGAEELVAELAASGYEVALQHGFKGLFIDPELERRTALRATHAREVDRPARAAGPDHGSERGVAQAS